MSTIIFVTFILLGGAIAIVIFAARNPELIEAETARNLAKLLLTVWCYVTPPLVVLEILKSILSGIM